MVKVLIEINILPTFILELILVLLEDESVHISVSMIITSSSLLISTVPLSDCCKCGFNSFSGSAVELFP